MAPRSDWPAIIGCLVILFAYFLRGIGLQSDDPFWKWLATTELGVLLYVALAGVLRVFWHPPIPVKIGPIVVGAPAALLALAACAFFLRRAADCRPVRAPQWTKAAVVLAIGLLFIAIEMTFFAFDDAVGHQAP